MSVLIKELKIPKDSKYVDVRIFRDGTATTASAEEPFYKKMDVVEVPTPHGNWQTIGNTGLASCKCGCITDRYSMYNFCPNCGADMRSET